MGASPGTASPAEVLGGLFLPLVSGKGRPTQTQVTATTGSQLQKLTLPSFQLVLSHASDLVLCVIDTHSFCLMRTQWVSLLLVTAPSLLLGSGPQHRCLLICLQGGACGRPHRPPGAQ